MIDQNFEEWDASEEGVDFRKISTPSTTYVSVFTFDEKYPEEAPTSVWKTLPPYFQKLSDNVSVYKNYEATDTKFLEELETLKKKHFFIVYVFGHGATDLISLWSPENGKRRNVKAAEIWEKLKDADRRFIIVFDACYSGSQLDVNMGEDGLGLLAAGTPFKEDEGTSIAHELVRMFDAGDRLMKSSGSRKPMFQVWSSTLDKHYSYYTPTSSTKFSSALCTTFKKNENWRYEKFWEELQTRGSMNTKYGQEDKWYIVPQRAKYGEDFDNNFVI